MNNSIAKYQASKVVFRHWTRKSYAVFNSLNKEFKIGQLTFEIGDRTFSKCTGSSYRNLQLYLEEEVESEEEESELCTDILLHQSTEGPSASPHLPP